MILLGQGRVGQGLRGLALANGQDPLCIDRTHGWEQLGHDQEGPILVCTNAGDLGSVIDRTPATRRPDLVFVQNGMIGDVLAELGCANNTRGLLYFAVPSRGCLPAPGDESVFTGPHAEGVTDWFRSIGLPAKGIEPATFANEMASKLIWNCTFGLLSDVYVCSVGELVINHHEAVSNLIAELVMVANASIETTLDALSVTESLCAYSLTIPEYTGALKQWEWRNGWFCKAGERLGLSMPIHEQFLIGRRP